MPAFDPRATLAKWTTVTAILRNRKCETLHVFRNAESVSALNRAERKGASEDVCGSTIQHRQKADADFELQSTEALKEPPCRD